MHHDCKLWTLYPTLYKHMLRCSLSLCLKKFIYEFILIILNVYIHNTNKFNRKSKQLRDVHMYICLRRAAEEKPIIYTIIKCIILFKIQMVAVKYTHTNSICCIYFTYNKFQRENSELCTFGAKINCIQRTNVSNSCTRIIHLTACIYNSRTF